VNKVVYID